MPKRSRATGTQGIRERRRADGSLRGYEVRYRDPDKVDKRGRPVVRGRTFKSKAEAKAFQIEVKNAIRQGSWIAPEDQSRPWGAVADEWLRVREVRLRARTRQGYEGILRRHLGHWRERPIGSLRKADVRAVLNDVRARGLAQQTEHRIYHVMKAVFRFAMSEGYINTSPTDSIKDSLRSVGDTAFKARPLTVDEAMRIINELPAGRFRLFGLLGLWTGFRAGELAGLRVRNLDPLRFSVQVDETVEDLGGHLRPGVPKTKKSRHRRVPVPREVMDQVMAYVQHQRLNPDDYVFTDREPLFHYQNFRNRQWLPACKAAGISVRFYDLRHTFASLRAQQGTPPHVLMDWMGHTSITTTMNIYAHVYEDDPSHRELVERLYERSESGLAPTTAISRVGE